MKFFSLLTISLLFHFLLWKGLSLPQTDRHATNSQPIDIDYIPTQPSQLKQSEKKTLVQETHLPSRLEEALKNLKKKARYLSKKNRRVKREQIAQITGATANRNNKSSKSAKKSNSSDSTNKTLQRRLSKIRRQDLVVPRRRPQLNNIVIGGPSTIGEHIPNVKSGGFTALNTDQFIYYTFYARINERIRNRWVDNVRNFINRTPLSLLSQGALRPQETQIEVLLSREGDYLETIIHKGSNFHSLDQAAVKAFAKSAPLPNPPEEMIEKDGKIHLFYSLYVIFDRQQLARAKRQQ